MVSKWFLRVLHDHSSRHGLSVTLEILVRGVSHDAV
jgi:hypothetical protein